MKFLPALFSVLLALPGTAPAAAAAGEASPLESGFTGAPPPQARPLVWWHWINGNVTKEGIRADLEDMKRAGIAGAQMLDVSIYLPPGPVRYGSALWHEHVQFALRTAQDLGLELSLMNSPGWSGSGGPWITPERAMKRYVWSETPVEGGPASQTVLPRPPTKLDFYRDVAVLAVPAGPAATALAPPALTSLTPVKLAPGQAVPTSSVLVLPDSLDAGGVLRHHLPPGRWTVLRFGYTATGSMNHPAQEEGHGLECDKLDADTVTFQFDHALGRIIREAGPLAGQSLRGILFDSFEGGYQNWSAGLPAEFRSRMGYDLTPWLPVLTGRMIGSPVESEAFLRDFRTVIGDLLAQNYFGTMQRLARSHGLQVYAEAQGGPLNPFLCNEFTDVPMNEFWMPDARPRFGNMKHIASVANLLGRPLVAAEAFTAKPGDGRWLATPGSMKAPGDCAFAAGINRFVLHTYVHQPYGGIAPGFTLGRYGTHFGRLNTWWPFANAWIAYLSRCQFLLQQGHASPDLLLLHDGEPAPFLPAKSLEVPPGYSFDVAYPRHLANLTWRDGAYHLPHGPAFRLLVLPKKWVASLDTLRQLKRLLSEGGAMAGSPPVTPAGLQELRHHLPEWQALAAEVAAGIKPSQSPAQATEAFRLSPGLILSPQPEGADVRFQHRITPDASLYFLSNQSGQPVTLEATFPEGHRLPELWDAVHGEIVAAPRFTPADGHIRVPLSLEASGSLFVVFRSPLPVSAGSPPASAGTPPTPRPSLAVPGPWQVRFSPNRGAPAGISLDHLISWTRHSNPGVRYFSGIATYATAFTAPDLSPDTRQVLRLGTVCDLAEVHVNGRGAGIVWTPPFELDITGLLHEGMNRMEIAVANRWVNRLIGDESLPPDAHYEHQGSKFTAGRLAELPPWLGNEEQTRRRQRVAFATWQFFEKDLPLLDSGLLGPVTIQSVPGRTRQPWQTPPPAPAR